MKKTGIARRQTSAVVLSKEENLYYEGREYATDLRIGIQSEFDKFLRSALPWAHRVFKAKPWRAAVYHQLYVENNTSESFRRFLKESLTDKSDESARQLALVLVVAVEEDLPLEQLIGKRFRWMLKYSYAASQLNRSERLRLFNYIDQAEDFQDFDREVREALAGHHVESHAAKLLQGPQSDIQAINRVVETVKTATQSSNKNGGGDGHRSSAFQTSIIANMVETVAYTEPDIPGFELFSRGVHLWCDVMREIDPSKAGCTDAELLYTTLTPMLPEYISEVVEAKQPIFVERYKEMQQHQIEIQKQRAAGLLGS